MKCFFTLFLLFTSTGLWAVLPDKLSDKKEPVEYVDPFIGTDFFGHMFPGASLPNAMVHLSPDVNTESWTYCSGYAYSENTIMGFSHTHWSGVGIVNGGEILLMPSIGNKLQVIPGSPKNPDEGYRSRFDHKDESASPGYYSVLLKDYNIKVELTATQRAGFQRYTFPKSNYARVILDLGHQIGEMSEGGISNLKILNNNRIEGAKSAGHGHIYFVAEFSKPFKYYGTFDTSYITPESEGSVFPYKNAEAGTKIGAFVNFDTEENEQILVRVGISYTSVEGARKNLAKEIHNWDFDKTKDYARAIWNKELSKIEISGDDEDYKQIFYTSVYHSLLAQYISQDVDGSYFGSDGNIHNAKNHEFYGSFSCWDTYRSMHPLMTLIAPEHVNNYIKSIVDKVENYNWLPAQHFLNVFGESMVGDHLIPIIVDAYKKGYRDYDVKKLYNAMRKKALEDPKPPVPKYAGRSGLDYYIKLGYTPVDKVTESVPNTLESAYDDWCIAQLAKELGKKDDYKLFIKRAGNYKNLWDDKTQFMRPKMADGTWLKELGENKQTIVNNGTNHYYKFFDPLLVGRRPNRYYTESNAWQYIWSVQQDIQGLINLFGSNNAFIQKLDSFFEMSPIITPPKYIGVVGTIGQYVQGNQPSYHVAYLYDYAGQPWKTQKWSRKVMTKLYRTGPGGLCGNEDMGSLSSWYVLSAMGFYPVTPGSNQFVIGSPLFNEVTIHLNKGKTFTIKGNNNSKENLYIQSATLNGKKFNRTYIGYDEITNGGILIFEMGPKPNKNWGISSDSCPYSMTKK